MMGAWGCFACESECGVKRKEKVKKRGVSDKTLQYGQKNWMRKERESVLLVLSRIGTCVHVMRSVFSCVGAHDRHGVDGRGSRVR